MQPEPTHKRDFIYNLENIKDIFDPVNQKKIEEKDNRILKKKILKISIVSFLLLVTLCGSYFFTRNQIYRDELAALAQSTTPTTNPSLIDEPSNAPEELAIPEVTEYKTDTPTPSISSTPLLPSTTPQLRTGNIPNTTPIPSAIKSVSRNVPSYTPANTQPATPIPTELQATTTSTPTPTIEPTPEPTQASPTPSPITE